MNKINMDVIKSALLQSKEGLEALISNSSTHDQILKAAQLCANTVKSKNRIFSCGNGGSMCDAMHFAEELTGRFRQNRQAIAAVAISDPSHLSCVANDFGYDHVFSRYLEAHGRPQDVLLAISTSGTSKNILEAAKFAKKNGVQIIALTGKPDCELGSLADCHIATPAGQWADRVQELHIKVIHILIELIEKSLII